MSTIRFVHSDFLRLGSALGGLSDCPTWLTQLATGAVRQAVRNVIEVAISQQAKLVLIAGRIAENREDLEPAARWLHEQFEPLRARGIAVVTVAEDRDSRAILETISDVVLRADESLQVTAHGDRVVLDVVSRLQYSSRNLLITVGDFAAPQDSTFVYQAMPDRTASTHAHSKNRHGRLALSAGCVQSVFGAETQKMGCLLVTANSETQELVSEFCACDVLRYRTEVISFQRQSSADAMVSAIVSSCESIDRDSDRTVIVDFVLKAEINGDLDHVHKWNPENLLLKLREQLHSGHRGIWPRVISFSEGTILRLASSTTPVVDEFAGVCCDAVQYHDRHGRSRLEELKHGTVVRQELLCGLSVLARVA